jgi:phosphopantothenate-cysteine ligase/phosphopantothenoylcysteine decarboxylase/phosphopantothenate--cysteine ligase
MNVLITAGNTQAPIDRVRIITNVFRGRTGARIAGAFARAGHRVRLLTSHPEAARADAEIADDATADRLEVRPYATFDDLRREMAEALGPGAAGGVDGERFDALIHSAAVSDYLCAGVFAKDAAGGMTDVSAGKVKSDEPELWLRLVRAPKLIDLVRTEWSFRGVIVKFKLEVGLTDERLLEIAERSRRHSSADLMVANTLEGAAERAFLGPVPGETFGPPSPAGGYRLIPRPELPERVVEAVESAAELRRSGL